MENGFGQMAYQERILDPIEVKKAYDKAGEILSSPIELEEFKGFYSGTMLAEDEDYVQKMEAIFKKDNSEMNEEKFQSMQLGKIFEAIVFQHAELSNWFGENAMTIQASRYDDIRNGVDTIVEFNDEQIAHYLALAIDVTTSANIREKFTKIREKIDHGKLTEIKYFISQDFKGQITNVPRVVIGADRETIKDVIGLWMNNDTKSLAEHPIQIKVLQEIKIQLEAFREYCEKSGLDYLVAIYDRGLKTINQIIESKSPEEEDIAFLERDEVFMSIKLAAENIKNAEPSRTANRQ